MSTQQTKKEKREAARQARLEAERRRRQAQQRKKVMKWVALGAVVAVAAVFGIQRFQSTKAAVSRETKTAGCGGLKTFPALARDHITPDQSAEYNSNPPTSGPHLGNTANWGSYTENVEDKLLLHNMEHGGVIIHYKDQPSGVVDEISDFADSFEEGVISTPNDKIEKSVVMAAWAKMISCERFSKIVAKDFVKRFCGKGPEAVGLRC